MSKKYHFLPHSHLYFIVIFVTNLTLVTGCITNQSLTSLEKKFAYNKKTSDFHQVKQGETLFSIALGYGIDYHKLASTNNIAPPYHIYPGQKIDIRTYSTKHSSKHKDNAKKVPKIATPKPNKKTTIVQKKEPPAIPSKYQHSMQWQWPANGRLIGHFSINQPINKGIDINGILGNSVMAAAAGTVVFAGHGLRGYGNLVIIEHNRQYLSAYAHVSRILVKEQENVKAGQVIAEIGSSGTNKVKLHFEIRSNGKAVNPVKYLPAR